MTDSVTIGAMTASALAIAAPEVIKGATSETVNDAYKKLKERVSVWACDEVETLTREPDPELSQLHEAIVAKKIDKQSDDDRNAVHVLSKLLMDALEECGRGQPIGVDSARIRAWHVRFGKIETTQEAVLQIKFTKIIAATVASIGAVSGVVTAIDVIVKGAMSWTCVAGILFPWCSPPDLAEEWSVEAGGAPSKPFNQLVCRDSEALVGVFGRAGEGPFIRAIGPICAAAKFNWHHELISLSSNAHKGELVVGTNQGEPFDLLCPPNTVVVGYDLDSSQVHTVFDGKDVGWHEYLVTPMRLKCANKLRTDTESTTVTQLGGSQGNANRAPFHCSNGKAAFGVKGTFGNFIDTVSIGCRRM